MKGSKVKKVVVIVACVVAGLGVLVLAFFGGYFVRGSVGVTSYDWLLDVISKYYYIDVDTEDADELAAQAIVEKYLDIYSEYYTAEEYAAQQSSNAGSKSGLGITYSYIPGTGITIVNTAGNSPAFRAGLRPSDVIEYAEFDGEEVYFNSSSDFSTFVAALDTGEEATYHCTSGEEFTFAKEEYTQSYVLFATADSAWTFTGSDALTMTESEGDAIEYLPEGAAYISLSQFYGSAAEQFCMAVEKFNELGCTSLIIDLRSNGGGSVSVMRQIAGCFEAAAGNTAMVALSKNGSALTYTAATHSQESTLSDDIDVYVLANSNTASASEALIGVLISYDIADYGDIYISEYSEEYLSAMGTTADSAKSGRTYGKGIMQSTYINLTTGEALKLTTHQIYWPDGTTIHGSGLSAELGCNLVSAPIPMPGKGEELYSAVGMIFYGST